MIDLKDVSKVYQIGDEKVTDFAATVEKSAFAQPVIVRKGKKVFHRFTTEA